MQKHTLTFKTFMDKIQTQKWVQEHINVTGEEECFAKKHYVFTTDTDLSPIIRERLDLEGFAETMRSELV